MEQLRQRKANFQNRIESNVFSRYKYVHNDSPKTHQEKESIVKTKKQ